jgi:hypothetical protein
VWLVKGSGDPATDAVTWTACTMTANFAICFLGWWRCFANNYLHWAAGTTWLLLIAQGNSAHTLSPCLSFCIRISITQSVLDVRPLFHTLIYYLLFHVGVELGLSR